MNLFFGRYAACNGEQVVDDLCRLQTGLLDCFNGRPELAVFWKLHKKDFRIADQAGKDVVEVVSHTTCHHADGFHFLGTLQLLFQVISFRDVDDYGTRPDNFLILPYGRGAHQHRKWFSFRIDGAILLQPLLTTLNYRCKTSFGLLLMLPGNKIEPDQVFLFQCL